MENKDGITEVNTIDNDIDEFNEYKDEYKKDTAIKSKFLKNVIIVLISNVISILSGVLVGFLIPKILGVSEYGYYKTFTLYSSYIGIFHFGFIDGIYLKFAGKNYDELDKKQFNTYTKFLFLMELGVSLITVAVSLFFIGTQYFLLLFFVSLNVLATNVTTYYEFISQVTMKFKRTTIRNIIRCSLNILSVIVLFLLYKFGGVTIYNTVYVMIFLAINYLLAIWYIITYKDITFGQSNSFKEEKMNILGFFRVGVPLLLANLIGQLVFVADQQIVNIAFENDVYSTYAFAYNMISLITVATSAIAVVLYPTLRNMNKDSITTNYSRINSLLLVFVSICLVAYFPLDLIVRWFLPKYINSLDTFKIILPGVLISSSISVIKYNCYKTFNKIINYFVKSLIVLIISVAANIAVYFIFGTTTAISMVSIAVLIGWYIVVEMYFVREYKVKWFMNFTFMILIIGGFYASVYIPNIYIAGVSYLLYAVALSIIFYNKILLESLKKILNRG